MYILCAYISAHAVGHNAERNWKAFFHSVPPLSPAMSDTEAAFVAVLRCRASAAQPPLTS